MNPPNRTNRSTWFAAAMSLPILMGSADAAVTYQKITSDADSGISSTNNYTHKIDFAESTTTASATVNGVAFDFYNKASGVTLNFSYVGGGNEDNNGGANAAGSLTGASGGLLQGFVHQDGSNAGANAFQTLTLSGLAAGTQYDLRIYAGQWRPGTDRSSTFTFDPDGAGAISEQSVTINEDNPSNIPGAGLAATDAFYINYRYTAVSGENLVVRIDTDNSVGASWHLYALTNQVVSGIPEPRTALLGAFGLLAFLRRRR